MKKKYKKIIVSILTMFVLLFYCCNVALCGSSFESTISSFGGTTNPDGSNMVKKIVKTILTIVRIVAAGLAIIMITVMGIKYMAAAATERAEIKNKLINFLIGVVLVAGATRIIEIAAVAFSNADLK